MNKSYILLGINILVCLFITAIISLVPHISMGYITIPFWILHVIGLSLVNTIHHKAGFIIFIIGSMFFVPFSLIGIYGYKCIVEEKNNVEFEERRRQVNLEQLSKTHDL